MLELQAKKKRLTDAIITADNSLLASIGRDELELLLSWNGGAAGFPVGIAAERDRSGRTPHSHAWRR